MIQRFSKNVFSTEYKKTLGVDFLMKKKYVKKVGKEIEFLIWDTAGQEYYDSITKRYYKRRYFIIKIHMGLLLFSQLQMKKASIIFVDGRKKLWRNVEMNYQ